MSFIKTSIKDPVRLKLVRDRTRMLKQGYPWIYADWLAEVPTAPAGTRALVRDKTGELLAFGMYDPQSALAVRVLAREAEQLNDELILRRLEAALKLRSALFSDRTTGYRLINGEGDGLPGLVCDLYGDQAVIKLDGDGPAGFWNLSGLSEWLRIRLGVKGVYNKFRAESESRGEVVSGPEPEGPIRFLENGLHFQANIVHGQKTGFFFDQRDNRLRVKTLARDRSVLNLFGYTGGFSVYAGAGQAKHVTTVDIAKPAILEAAQNWKLNNLSEAAHRTVAADVFEFLAEAKSSNQQWDLIIVDPPSFAHAERQVEKAKESYQSLFASALNCLLPGGIIALSSCSSHISTSDFLEICQAALSKSKRRANVLGVYGQPEDHPFPFACLELQYLKFVTFSVD